LIGSSSSSPTRFFSFLVLALKSFISSRNIASTGDDDLLQATENMNYWTTKKHFQVKNVGIEINDEKLLAFLSGENGNGYSGDKLHCATHRDTLQIMMDFHVLLNFTIPLLWRKQIANNMNGT
jgi:hypothetical protein